MSASIDRHGGGRVVSTGQSSTMAGQMGPQPITLRKSCDLCVRLKRACDGNSPCNLCSRRRESCTRSVKRKSGPAKGTKYTTRRQRLEAGIPDPPRPKRKAPKAKANSPAAAAAVAAVTSSSAVAKGNTLVSGDNSSSRGRGTEGGGGGGRGGLGTAIHDAHEIAVKREEKNKKGSNAQAAVVAPVAPPGGHHVQPPPVDREHHHMIHAALNPSTTTTTGSSSNSGGANDFRGRKNTAQAVAAEPKPQPKLEANATMPKNGGASPRSSGFFADSQDPPVPRSRDRINISTNGGGGGDGMDVVPRGPVSPLILPVLPWPSPSLPPTAAPTPAGGPSLDGVSVDMTRGRSTSPFGLLPGPPAAVSARPRRGGTREPYVETGVHYRAPLGVQSTKRYRLSPPFSTLTDQRAAGECNLEMSMANGDVQPKSGDAGGGGGGGSGFRQGTRRVPRDHHVGGSPFSSGQVFTPSLPYTQPSDVGSFDSSNALGAILDRRHVRGSDGGRVNNGIRCHESNRPSNAGSQENLRELRDPAPPLPYGRQQQQQQQQQEHQVWDQSGMRFLPHPASTPGATDARMSSLEGDQVVNRWRQLENAGNRANMEGSAWRRRDGAGAHRHGYGSGVGGEISGGGSGVGGGRGGMMETARDLLAEQAAPGGHGGGWEVNTGGAASPQTVLITHGDDDDITGIDGGRGWGVVDPRRGDGNQTGARGGGGGAVAWAFSANAAVPNNGRTIASANHTGVGGGVVGDGSDSDLGAVGLSSPAGNAAVGAVPNGSGSGGPGGRDGGGGGGVWPEDPLVLPSPPASPAAKIAQQKHHHQQGHAPQHARVLAMPLPNASGTGGIGDRNGGVGGSPFFSGAQYRCTPGMSPSMETFRGGSFPHHASPWQQQQSPGLGPGGAHRTVTASIADSRAAGGPDAWVNDPGGSVGGNEAFLDGSVGSFRDPTPGRGTTGHGGWPAPWSTLPDKRAGFDRDGAWPTEYSI